MEKKVNIRPKSGLTYAVKYTADIFKQGLNKSKHRIYKENQGKSPYIHSFSTFNRYMGIIKDFVKYAKEQNINRLDKVDRELVEKYLAEKASRYTEKTLKVNASALRKFFETVERQDLAEYIKENYRDFYSKAMSSNRSLAFSNPDRVIFYLKGDAHKAMAKLQLLTGARVGDIKKISIDEKNKKVIIHKSKGGKTREINYEGKEKEFEEIKALKKELDTYIKKEGWKTLRESYYPDLRHAVQKAGEIYTGAHAFRVNYVKNRFIELKELGYEEKEALQIIENEIGHNRIEMSIYYAKG